jgi:hypothetical protein
MTLRAGVIDREGRIREEVSLDERVCDCCQTSTARINTGAVIVYRDRSDSEIRDVSIVRYATDGRRTQPRPVAGEGWRIEGCPVNGPAVAAAGLRVAVAWFTFADSMPRVLLAFSDNEGETFSEPLQVDDGDPMGRVDIVLLAEGSAMVSWMEYAGDGAHIRLRRVWSDGRLADSYTLVPASKERTSGFPVMTSNGREILVAWTEVGSPMRVRAASLRLE